MSCLFLTYENPFTLDAGDHIYTESIIKALHHITGDVDLIYYDSNPKEPLIDHYPYGGAYPVKFETKNLAKFIFTSRPAPITNRISERYLQTVQILLKSNAYDLIVVNHFKMCFLIDHLKCWIKEYNRTSQTLLVTHNSEYLLSANLSKHHRYPHMRLAYYIDSERIKVYEKRQLNKFHHVSCISENDEHFFKEFYGCKNTLICRPVIYSQGVVKEKNDIKDAIICGSFHWGPKKVNLLKFLQAKNLNALKENGIKLYVVGKSDGTLVKSINGQYGDKGIYMTGPVPSTSEYYDKTSMAIIPEKLGGGFKLKVIEAAINQSLVIAIKGAITQSNFIQGVHFLECETFEDIVDTIVKVAKREIDPTPLILNAYNLVKEEYSCEKLQQQLWSVFKKKVQGQEALPSVTSD